MGVLQVVVSKSDDDRHGALEGVDEVLEFLLDGIFVEVLLETHADLGEVVCLLGDLFGLDGVELSLDPYLLELLPLIEGAPHQASESQVLTKLVKLIENGRRRLQDLLPLVVLEGASLKLLEASLLLVEDLKHFEHVGLAREEDGVKTFFMEPMNLAVKLRDKFVKRLLKGLSIAFLGALNRLDDGRELADLLHALREVVLVLLLDLQGKLGKGVVDLAKEVNAITNVLEVVVSVNQVTVLFNEFFNVSNGLREV